MALAGSLLSLRPASGDRDIMSNLTNAACFIFMYAILRVHYGHLIGVSTDHQPPSEGFGLSPGNFKRVLHDKTSPQKFASGWLVPMNTAPYCPQ